MLSLSDNQADVVEAFNSTSRYLDDLRNTDNPYFAQMVSQIYPTELQLNKANPSDTEAPMYGLKLAHYKWHSFNQIYQKQDDFILKRLIFHFLMGISSLPFLWCIHFATYSFCKSMFSC